MRIVKTSNGYALESTTGRRFTKGNLTLEQAKKRLNQIEWIHNYPKWKDNWKKEQE